MIPSKDLGVRVYNLRSLCHYQTVMAARQQRISHLKIRLPTSSDPMGYSGFCNDTVVFDGGEASSGPPRI